MRGLERFRAVQQRDFKQVTVELERGRKTGHWMWYMFPQLAGLGQTEISRHYGINDIQEATDYLLDQELGQRLSQLCKTLLQLPASDAHAIFGTPDDLKLRSCMTLFDAVPATFPVFGQVLDKFYNGERDPLTLNLLKKS